VTWNLSKKGEAHSWRHSLVDTDGEVCLNRRLLPPASPEQAGIVYL
jgi:hypothetical protein